MLQQDWDEDTADIDLSCNIQNILDELNEDEAKSDDTFLASDDKENIEDKENVEAKKLFPLFYKDSAKSSASNQ